MDDLDYADHRATTAAAEEEEEEVDEDEAISLRDLPLTTTTNTTANTAHHQDRRSSSEVAELFEFFTNLDSSSSCNHAFSSADELIFSGQLLPSAPPPPPHPLPPRSLSSLSCSRSASTASSTSAASIHTLRSESLNESRALQLIKCARTPQRMMRPSRSLNYRRLRRTSSTPNTDSSSAFNRNLSNRSVRRSIKPLSEGSSNSEQEAKLPWYWLKFGLIKFPTEMELKDIRYRQQRKTPSTLFPPVDKLPDHHHHHRSGWKDSSWRLISVLSCKNHESVAIATSFHSIPKA